MADKTSVEMIENNPESFEAFHQRGWGRSDWYLTKEQLQQLQSGKAIAIDDGEYTHTIILEKN